MQDLYHQRYGGNTQRICGIGIQSALAASEALGRESGLRWRLAPPLCFPMVSVLDGVRGCMERYSSLGSTALLSWMILCLLYGGFLF